MQGRAGTKVCALLTYMLRVVLSWAPVPGYAAITISISNYINKLPVGFMAANQSCAHTFFSFSSLAVIAGRSCADTSHYPDDWRMTGEILCPSGMGRIN